MILLTILLIPSIIALGFLIFGGKKFTVGEFLLLELGMVLILGVSVLVTKMGSTRDVEVWNGRIAEKHKQKVSCEHSYRCFCVSISCGKDCTTEVCQTCYYHSHDFSWLASTTNKESIYISRIDWQGVDEPPRWTKIIVGEPSSISHPYKNYIKASPDSLFRQQGLVDKYKDKIPPYPGEVYDYYRLNRLVLVNGASVPDPAQWNIDLSEMNGDIGGSKHVNVITVLTKNLPEEYYYALEQAWIGSKQNDFVTIINTDDAGKITWVNVMAFTQNKLAEVVVRDSILKVGTLNRELIMNSIRVGVVNNYIKRKMSDFQYLENSITPTKGMWIFLMILGLILSVGGGIFFLNNDYDDVNEQYSMNRSNIMGTGTKIVIGVVGLMMIVGVVGISSIIGINNDLTTQEAGLGAQYKQNQNNYDNMVKKVLEVAQVPSMAAGDLEKLTKAAISGRYGAQGSKAVFQFIKEQNPTVNGELYSKIQTVIEAGRNSFEAEQKVLLDKKRVYEVALNTFPSGLIARTLGFPKINLAMIDIVTSNRTEKAFGDKKDEAISLAK